jgi:hypothetical protein
MMKDNGSKSTKDTLVFCDILAMTRSRKIFFYMFYNYIYIIILTMKNKVIPLHSTDTTQYLSITHTSVHFLLQIPFYDAAENDLKGFNVQLAATAVPGKV